MNKKIITCILVLLTSSVSFAGVPTTFCKTLSQETLQKFRLQAMNPKYMDLIATISTRIQSCTSYAQKRPVTFTTEKNVLKTQFDHGSKKEKFQKVGDLKREA